MNESYIVLVSEAFLVLIQSIFASFDVKSCFRISFISLTIGGFHVTSQPPCWWTKTKDFSLAPFVRPPAIVHCSIVICVPRDWLQTTYNMVPAFF